MTTGRTASEIVKGLKARRRGLCFDRRVWELKIPNFLPIDYYLTCAHTEPEPYCEGCAAKGTRTDRLTEISAGIKAIDGEITAITGKPYMTTKPGAANPPARKEKP